MKQTNDKEMELLLSRLGRREGGGVRDGLEDGAEHPDADELNAYAENALTPAARSRYTAHIADCRACRAMVAELVAAAGVAASLESEAAKPAIVSREHSWGQSIAAFFNLPFVRYGVPALALIAVISIVFLATRQQQGRADRTLVAQRTKREPVSAVRTDAEPEENHAVASTNTTTTAEANSNASTTNSGAFNSNANISVDQQSGAAAQRGELKTTVGNRVEDGADEKPAPSIKTEPSGSASTVAAGPPPAPSNSPTDAFARSEAARRNEANKDSSPKPSETVTVEAAPIQPEPQPQNNDAYTERGSASGGSSAAVARKQQQSDRERARDESQDQSRNGTYNVQEETAIRAPTPPPSSARRRVGAAGGLMSRKAREEAPAPESAGESRSVAGRTFRRQGGAWVDTAYNSSRATVNVSRGSEQYRALVADEPSLRTIAEQLGGEVIVVWKGRAYRIH